MNTDQKTCQTLEVAESLALVEDVYSLTLEYSAEGAPQTVRPGQFVGIYPNDSARLLPRPISICGWDAAGRRLRLVYRIVGSGTRELSRLRIGDRVRVLGILGNGYDVLSLKGKRLLLLGGGIGAPPLLGLAQALQEENAAEVPACGIAAGGGAPGTAPGSRITSVLGYRTKAFFLTEEFAKVGRLVVATDDGSVGFHGNAVEAARTLIAGEGANFDVIAACGPLPMLRGVKALSRELEIPAYLSLEERMACGIGACLGCVTRTAQVDGHSHVRNTRICTEGPVFPAEEVEL